MKHRNLVIALTAMTLMRATTAMASITFAQTTQAAGGTQFTVLQSPGGTVTITGAGQDLFTYQVAGTPFAAFVEPVLANFLFSATSNQSGACGTAGCPGSDSYTQQGYTGSFS